MSEGCGRNSFRRDAWTKGKFIIIIVVISVGIVIIIVAHITAVVSGSIYSSTCRTMR